MTPPANDFGNPRRNAAKSKPLVAAKNFYFKYMKTPETDDIEEAKRISTALRKAPSKKQWKFVEKLCGNNRHLRVREFMIIDGTKFKGGAIQSVAYHPAGGIWKGYNIPFEEFVEFLNAHPEEDADLMMDIYSV